MNILFINHYAGSLKHGMEYRPYYLAREWVKLGHQVTIVAASFSHLRKTQPKISDKLVIESLDGIRYVWLKTNAYKGNGLSRVINIFSFTNALYSIDENIIGFKPDIIVASSPHPFIIYPARYIQKKYKSKLIFEVRDLWPLTLIELGNMSKWHPFVILMQYAEKFAYRKANKVVSLLPKASEYMLQCGATKEKIIYIPNGFAIDDIEHEELPNDYLTFFNKYNDNFLIGYTGTFTESDTLDVFINASKFLPNNVHFVLVGDGQYKETLKQKISQESIKNVTILSSVYKNLIPVILSKFDAVYIGWKRNTLYRFGISPNKLFDYMMAGKPVIHAIEAGNDMVAESRCGISILPEDPIAIADAVKKLMSMSSAEREKMGQRGKEYTIANHDYKALAKKFLEEI